ncbi:MAG: hypothetical protein RQ751_04745 [Longimicrobiales bacterium]|nr:hypothetical protein [Longimicrobiales bacterium]
MAEAAPPGLRRIALLLLAGLGACGGGDGPPAGAGQGAGAGTEAESSGPPSGGAAAVETSAGPERLTGYLTVEGRPEVALCRGGALSVDGPALPDLLDLHLALAPGLEPLEGVFVDVLGEVRSDDRETWLDALEVRRASFEGWGCRADEAGLVLDAWGNEPFWSLTVGPETAMWRTPEGERSYGHDGPFPLPRGGWALEGVTADGSVAWSAQILQRPCQDTMSGAYAHLEITVELGGSVYRGCAYSGAAWDDGP